MYSSEQSEDRKKSGCASLPVNQHVKEGLFFCAGWISRGKKIASLSRLQCGNSVFRGVGLLKHKKNPNCLKRQLIKIEAKRAQVQTEPIKLTGAKKTDTTPRIVSTEPTHHEKRKRASHAKP